MQDQEKSSLFEDKQGVYTPQKEIIEPQEIEKEIKPYLEFTEHEKDKIIKKIIVEQEKNGEKIDSKEVVFPESKEEIESWIVGSFINSFDSNRLLEVALKDSESAPKLLKELAKRKDYDLLEPVLAEYAKGNFHYFCELAKKIESGLKDDENADRVLMALSKSLAEKGEQERVAEEKFFEYMKGKPERASRNFPTYLEVLMIDEERAKELLNQKSLLLIGGGIGPVKKGVLETGINCNITNVEPLLSEKTEENCDTPIPKNFYDVKQVELGKHDEVWSANNSLPTYAFNPEQVKNFYQGAIKAVKKGGFLRVYPSSGFSDSITPAMRLSRLPTNHEAEKIISLLEQRPDLFEVERYTTPPKKSLMGQKASVSGVNIKVIGDSEKVDHFLEIFG